MAKTIILISGLLVAFNLLLGLILSIFPTFNVIVSTLVIILSGLILFWNAKSGNKDGFKTSLYVIVSFLGLVEYVMAVFMPSQFHDNILLIITALAITVEFIILIATSMTSKYVK